MGGYNFGSSGPYWNGISMLNDSSFFGTRFYVRPYTGKDGNTGRAPDKAVKTLAKAKSMATADKGDVVYLIAESNTAASTTDYQETALDWNKDGVHLIGVGSNPMIGQRARIAQLSTVKDIGDLFTVSADNCLIANIEVFQGVASATATTERAMVVSGQRNQFVNCQISGIGDTSMDDAGSCSLAVIYPAAENIFKHCYIGLDTAIRATATAEIRITGTGVAARVPRTIFEDCIINSYTSLETFKACIVTYGDRFVLFKNCIINAVQNITSAVSPTGAIAHSDPNGSIILHGTSVYGYDNVTTANDSSTLISSFGANAADTGLAGAVTIS
jgi:hypothetical protein